MSSIERVDQLEKHYAPIEKCEQWAGYLFWICAVFSVGIPYSDLFPFEWLQHTLWIFFVLSVVAYSVLSHYSSFFLIPFAERQRRKQLLSNALDVPLIPETTKGYYNNLLGPSFARLAACVLENAFFAKGVCHEMAKRERVRVFVYALVWLAAISCRSTDLGLVLSLTQVLFSGEILIRWIKIEFLRSRNDDVYNNLYSHFLNRISPSEPPGLASILDSFASYEAAKAAASIKQSSKIFHRLNPRLSDEWDNIRRTLQIDQLDSNQANAADAKSRAAD